MEAPFLVARLWGNEGENPLFIGEKGGLWREGEGWRRREKILEKRRG
jgi:hypothetical protein